MSAIILGGGRSSRLGQDKVSLIINGESILPRTISRLNEVSSDIIIVKASGDNQRSQTISPEVRIVTDFESSKGPLMGIYTGMKASHDDYCLVVACDMPFLNIDLLYYMTSRIPGYDAVVPFIKDEVEPLHAVYSTDCIDIIEQMIQQNDLKVRNLLGQIRVRYIGQDEIDHYDPDHLSWFNINTPDDLKRAGEIMKREKTNDRS